MAEREEVSVVTLTSRGENGDKYLARLSNGVIDVQVDTSENSFGLRVGVAALGKLIEFLAIVQADPAAQPPATLETIPQTPEPTPEPEATNTEEES